MNVPCICSVEGSFQTKRPLPAQSYIPYGMAIIATCLKTAGHDPKVFVLTPNSDIEAVVGSYIEESKPKLYCLTAVSTQFPFIMTVAEKIKRKDPDAFIVLGGVHASLNPEACIREPFLDAICIGEGEKAVVELAKQLGEGRRPSHINNLWIKNVDGVERNPIAEFLQDLDSVPVIDRSMWYPWIEDVDQNATVLIGRGCPNRCAYCCNHAISRVSPGRYVRYRSSDSIIAEVRRIVEERPEVKEIYLECETITVNLRFTFELLGRIESLNSTLSRPVRFSANASMVPAIADNQAFFEQLRRANFRSIKIGLESGSPRIRKEVLRRPPYTNNDLVTFCRNLRAHGMEAIVYVMMGLPSETVADYRETVECVRQCAPDIVYLNIYYPYPGTDLYKIEKEQGLITDGISTDSERKKPVLDRPGFSKRQVRREFVLFYARSLRGIYPRSKVLKLTVENFLLPHPTLVRAIGRLHGGTRKA